MVSRYNPIREILGAFDQVDQSPPEPLENEIWAEVDQVDQVLSFEI